METCEIVYTYEDRYENVECAFEECAPEELKARIAELESDPDVEISYANDENGQTVYEEGRWLTEEEIEENLHDMEARLEAYRAEKLAAQEAEKERLASYDDKLDEQNYEMLAGIVGNETNIQRVKNALERAGYYARLDDGDVVAEVGEREYRISLFPRMISRNY